MPTNRWKQTNIYPSPNAGDVVFFEWRDPDLSENRGWSFGDLHPNQSKFAGYKLVHVKPQNEGGREQWFYAKEWTDQENHNWRVSYPYAGITTCPRFSCTFILPRDTYEPEAKGTAHPLDLGDSTLEKNERFKGAKLVSETQVSTGFQEIDNLFMAVERVYDRIPDEAEQLLVNIETTFPHGGLKEYPRRVRQLLYPRQSFVPVTKGTADPIYTNAVLIEESQMEIGDETLKSLYVAVRRVYDEVPTIAAQEGYNEEITYPHINNVSFPRTTRTYLIPREDLGTAVIPSAGLNLNGASVSYRKVDRLAGQPEDSYYVVVTIVYDRVPDITTQLTYNVETTYPHGGLTAYPRYTRTLLIARGSYSPVAKGTADPTYASAVLIEEEQLEINDEILKPGYVMVRRVYDTTPTIAAQEAYNAEVTYPHIGNLTFPRTTRTYLVPRSSLSGATIPSAGLSLDGATVSFRKVDRMPGQGEDSYYVVVTIVYDKVPDTTTQLGYNVERTYPHGGLTSYPRYTRTLLLARNSYAPVAKGTADTVYTSAVLIEENQVELNDEILKPNYVLVSRVYDTVPTIAAQEAYNSEISYPYFGDTRFPRTTRKYLVPRSSLSGATIPSAGLSLGGATLAFRQVDRIEGQGDDSYYVVVTVAHDRIPLASDVAPGGEYDFLKGYGYQISRPYGTDDHPRVTWRVPAVKSGFTMTAEYAACPISGYTGLLLTDETFEADPDNASNVVVVRVYDSLPGPELEAEEREKFVSVPEGFIVERRVETLRQPVKNDATITALDTDSPTDAGGTLTQTRLGVDGQSTVVLGKGQTRLKLTLGTLTSVEYDEETGKVFNVTREIVPAGTAGSGLSAITKEFSTVEALNQEFSIKTTRKATTLGTSTDSITYDTIINYAWPPVLQAVNFFAVEHKTGYLIRYGWDILMKEAYVGPCRATIVESWSPTAQAVPTVAHMMPTAIEFDFPMTRNFFIPRCLHPAVSLTETVGTDHPELAYAVTNKSFAATNYTDWPNTLVAAASQVPYRGGFKMRVTTVYKPS